MSFLSSRATSAAILLALSGVLAPFTHAQNVSVLLPAAADTTLFQTSDGSLANGAGEYMFVGLTVRGLGERRALIRFNLASIPTGANILSAELRLHCSRNNSSAAEVQLRRVLRSWGEGLSNAGSPGGAGATASPGDATWLHAVSPSSFWLNPGGDYASAVSAATTLAPFGLAVGSVTWASTTGTVADVQTWLNNPAQNFGWLILGGLSPDANAHRFDTRENLNPDLRPVLAIVYAPPCCRADFNCQNGVTVQDIFDFLAAWFALDPRADFNAQNGVTVQDIFDFLAAWFAGCA